MDMPSEARRVIDELVKFWQSSYEPHDLIIHIDRLTSTWGSGIGVTFFRQVYNDLRTGKRSNYAAFSALEFKQFLETEYSHQAQVHAEHQAIALTQAKAEAERLAQAKAEEREESERRARANFDALGKEMEKATTREELVELGRKRAALAQFTGRHFVYKNHCWQCGGPISSEVHAWCPSCTFYICTCGTCLCGRILSPKEPFLPDFPDDAS